MSMHLHEHGAVVRTLRYRQRADGSRRLVSELGLFGNVVVLPYRRAARMLEHGMAELMGGCTQADFDRAAERYVTATVSDNGAP